MLIISAILAKNIIIRNFDIFGNMGKKRDLKKLSSSYVHTFGDMGKKYLLSQKNVILL